jgi:hypothetical protein
MCQFFSFVTDPVNHPAEYYHFDWEYRKANLDDDGVDSHSHICAHFALNEDKCNKYEFNPLTKKFEIDMINSERDDSVAAEKWVKRLDFKTVIEPLIVKPIVNPLELPKVEQVTDEQIGWLKDWSSAGDSVGYSVWYSVWASVRSSGWDAVGAAVGASVRSSVWDAVVAAVGYSVWYSVWAYVSSFFAIDFKHDFSSAVKLWEAGLVPAFDGTTWRLHSGTKADVVYEWTPEVQE